MIFIGYQGIGKSTLAGYNRYIDLESGNFWVNGKRDENWYIPYCNIAKHLSEQGYRVFTSSHEVVRNYLSTSKENCFVIYPALHLKNEWIEKLKLRYENSKLDKDYKAYMNAVDRYEDNIKELMDSGFNCIEIDNMDYKLDELIVKTITKIEYKQILKDMKNL